MRKKYGKIWKKWKLPNSPSQAIGIHPHVPNIHQMNNIGLLIVIIHELKTVQNQATTIASLSVFQQGFWRI